MPSKFTLAAVACIAYGAASVMALPAQGAYGLSERDFTEFSELEARLFDNGFEDFITRQVAASPAAEAPAPPAAVPMPMPPADAKTLALTGASGNAPLPHPHQHGGRRRHNSQNQPRHGRQHHSQNRVNAGTKETAVSASDASALDQSAPAPPVAAREAPRFIEARAPPVHQAGARRFSARHPPRTPEEIIFDKTLDGDQRREELLAAKRYRDAVARQEALQAARLKRKQAAELRSAAGAAHSTPSI